MMSFMLRDELSLDSSVNNTISVLYVITVLRQHHAFPSQLRVHLWRFINSSPSLPLSLPLRVRPISWSTKSIPLRGCPRTILSDDGLQFCSKSSQAVQQLLGVRKLATSSYHPNGNGGATSSNRPNGNGGVERVNHTMAQMLAIDFFFVLPTTPFVR